MSSRSRLNLWTPSCNGVAVPRLRRSARYALPHPCSYEFPLRNYCLFISLTLSLFAKTVATAHGPIRRKPDPRLPSSAGAHPPDEPGRQSDRQRRAAGQVRQGVRDARASQLGHLLLLVVSVVGMHVSSVRFHTSVHVCRAHGAKSTNIILGCIASCCSGVISTIPWSLSLQGIHNLHFFSFFFFLVSCIR